MAESTGMELKVLHQANPLRRAYLSRALTEFNARHVPADQAERPLDVLLLDAQGGVRGGIIARVLWNLLEIDVCWVEEPLRGQGHWAKLLAAAEREARGLDCRAAVLNTFSFQAPQFYLRQGYQVLGVLEDCPQGHCRYYLRKAL